MESDASRFNWLLSSPPANSQQVVRLPAQVYALERQAAVEWRVPIVNRSGMSLKFADPKASCGCSGAALESTTLPRDGQTLFNLSVKPDGAARVRTVSVNVKPDDAGDDVWWRYWLEAPLYPQAAFVPRETLFGPVRPDERPARPITLTTCAVTEGQLPKLIAVRTDNPHLAAGVENVSVSQNEDGLFHQEIALTLRVSPSRTERGMFRAHVLAQFDDPSTQRKFELTSIATWSVPSQFTILPARIFFGRLSGRKSPIQAIVALESDDIDDLQILSVHSTHPGVSAHVQEEDAGPLRHLLVNVDPERVTGPLWTELVVATNNELEPTVRIPVAALP